ncbi:hypothetical protein EDB86DRAFT_3242877 [Lactarius hatsudake]|nr:hypothetical protein EDB86DRAFT_3242877 [Lactarius hatsudake]
MLLSDQRIMQLLIQNGADVNAQDGDHLTPLHLASYRGDAKMVELLLQHGADFRAQDQNHSMPLHLASARGNAEIVQLLIDHGANVDPLDRSYSKPVRIIEPLPADDQSPSTNTVAMLSELKSSDPPGPVPLLSHYLTHSDQFRNAPGSGSATTTESETSIGDIVKIVERFRLLVVGRSCVGKSSLISRVNGHVSVEHHKPREADIQRELVSPENQYFVLHDSNGFEPGDLSNFETHLPMKDRIHGLWLCTEIPTAGGRVFERGDEYLLKFAHDIQIPVVLVFIQYDRLVRTKEAELGEEHPDMERTSLHNQGLKDARDAFNKCLQSLQHTFDRLNIPMPRFAKVSVRPRHQEEGFSTLAESTGDALRDRLEGDAWIMWSIAQRLSPSVKMEACVTRFFSGMPGSERLLIRDCLEKVHRDIVTCWNFKGASVLDSKEFAYLMLRLSQDIQTKPGAYHSNIDLISQFVALVTSASPPTQPLESILGFTPDFVQWLSTAVLENTSWLQRFLFTYTVDLVSVLRKLFDTTLTATWDGVREAYGAYEQSGSRQRLHNRILSNTAPGGFALKKGSIDGMVRV